MVFVVLAIQFLGEFKNSGVLRAQVKTGFYSAFLCIIIFLIRYSKSLLFSSSWSWFLFVCFSYVLYSYFSSFTLSCLLRY